MCCFPSASLTQESLLWCILTRNRQKKESQEIEVDRLQSHQAYTCIYKSGLDKSSNWNFVFILQPNNIFKTF